MHEGGASPWPRYGRQALTHWVQRIGDTWPPGADVFAYFNNDQGGAAVRDCAAFTALAARSGLRVTAARERARPRRADWSGGGPGKPGAGPGGSAACARPRSCRPRCRTAAEWTGRSPGTARVPGRRRRRSSPGQSVSLTRPARRPGRTGPDQLTGRRPVCASPAARCITLMKTSHVWGALAACDAGEIVSSLHCPGPAGLLTQPGCFCAGSPGRAARPAGRAAR